MVVEGCAPPPLTRFWASSCSGCHARSTYGRCVASGKSIRGCAGWGGSWCCAACLLFGRLRGVWGRSSARTLLSGRYLGVACCRSRAAWSVRRVPVRRVCRERFVFNRIAARGALLPPGFRRCSGGVKSSEPFLTEGVRGGRPGGPRASAVPNGDPARLWKAYTIIYTYRPKYTLYETCVVPSWTGIR